MEQRSRSSCALVALAVVIGGPVLIAILLFVASQGAKGRVSFTKSDLGDMLKAHAKKSEVISRLQVFDYKPWLWIDRDEMSRQEFVPDQPKPPPGATFTEAWTIDLPSTEPWVICGYDHEAQLWFDEHDRLAVVRYATRPHGCF